MTRTLFTVGHSAHTLPHLVSLLRKHGVNRIADVRFQPYSRRNPHFNRESFKAALSVHSIEYLFLGNELGGRASDSACVSAGRVDYRRLAMTDLFREGLRRINREASQNALALMCAEKDPLTCHRTILVCRHLQDSGLSIQHILEDGRLESQTAAEERLLAMFSGGQNDLFSDRSQLLERAYDLQGEQIAYRVDEEAMRREAVR